MCCHREENIEILGPKKAKRHVQPKSGRLQSETHKTTCPTCSHSLCIYQRWAIKWPTCRASVWEAPLEAAFSPSEIRLSLQLTALLGDRWSWSRPKDIRTWFLGRPNCRTLHRLCSRAMIIRLWRRHLATTLPSAVAEFEFFNGKCHWNCQKPWWLFLQFSYIFPLLEGIT